MVDFAYEKPLTLKQLAGLVPFSYSTLHKWTKYGHKVGDQVLKLETRPFPGKVLTSLEAFGRFSDMFRDLEEQPVPAVPRDRNEQNRLEWEREFAS